MAVRCSRSGRPASCSILFMRETTVLRCMCSAADARTRLKPLWHQAVIVSRSAGQSGWSCNGAAVGSSRRVRADWPTAVSGWWARRSPIVWTDGTAAVHPGARAQGVTGVLA